MSDAVIALGGGSALLGAWLVVVFALRKPSIDAGAVLAELEGSPSTMDAYQERLAEPIVARLFKPVGRRLSGGVSALVPRNYLDQMRKRLITSGLADRFRPEEFVVIQLVTIAAGILGGTLLGLLMGWSTTGILRGLLVFGLLGAYAPVSWSERKKEARQTEVRRDLPDVLDLLAISVEAGVGLEGAIEVVGQHFTSTLAFELNRTLREMELGLSRREALQNLKRRTEVPEVSNFVLALIQADALGMPMSKVLRIQAGEMRAKRRQWAREKAAKLPVKILFPMFLFIFPALFVVVVGPAVASIMKNIL